MFEPNLMNPFGVQANVNAMPNSQILIRDLNLDRVMDRITRQSYIRDTVAKYLVTPALDARTIYYRQEIYKDFERLKDTFVEDIFRTVGKTTDIDQSRRGGSGAQSKINVYEQLKEAIGVADKYFDLLVELGEQLRSNRSTFQSEGLLALTDKVIAYVDSAEFKELREILANISETLQDSKGIKLWVEFGAGLKASTASLCEISDKQYKSGGFLGGLFSKDKSEIFINKIPEGITNDLENAKKEAILHVKSIVQAMSAGVSRFFGDLRTEVSFYMGIVKIIEKATELGMPVCFPKVSEDKNIMKATGLYDLSMVFALNKPKERMTESDVIFNDLVMNEGDMLIITGLNQGGKTTFLRAAGIAQVLMQSGAPVPAETFESSISDMIYTHFPEEEDKDMKYGKLAEELARLREAFEVITGNSLILLNDSFATTTTGEGSVIAVDVTKAMAALGCRVIFVSHLFEYASTADQFNADLAKEGINGRAVNFVCGYEEQPDGNVKRTYKIFPGTPEQKVFAKEFETAFSASGR